MMLGKALFWMLFAVPEGIIMIIVGLGCLGIRRPFARLALAGVLIGTTTVMSRWLLTGGYHVPIALFSYCIVLVFVLRVSVRASIIACLVSSLLINFGQILVALPFLKAFGLSIEDTLRSTWLHIAFGWVGDTLLIIGALFVTARKAVLIPIPESKQSGSVDHRG